MKEHQRSDNFSLRKSRRHADRDEAIRRLGGRCGRCRVGDRHRCRWEIARTGRSQDREKKARWVFRQLGVIAPGKFIENTGNSR